LDSAVFRLPHRIFYLLYDVRQFNRSEAFGDSRFGYGNRNSDRYAAEIINMGQQGCARQPDGN
jgi:hypothetical protein